MRSSLPSVLGLDQVDVSLLDVIDHVLNQGIVISGELTLGVADVDLIYVRLLALICSADRVAGVPGKADSSFPEEPRGLTPASPPGHASVRLRNRRPAPQPAHVHARELSSNAPGDSRTGVGGRGRL